MPVVESDHKARLGRALESPPQLSFLIHADKSAIKLAARVITLSKLILIHIVGFILHFAFGSNEADMIYMQLILLIFLLTLFFMSFSSHFLEIGQASRKVSIECVTS